MSRLFVLVCLLMALTSLAVTLIRRTAPPPSDSDAAQVKVVSDRKVVCGDCVGAGGSGIASTFGGGGGGGSSAIVTILAKP